MPAERCPTCKSPHPRLSRGVHGDGMLCLDFFHDRRNYPTCPTCGSDRPEEQILPHHARSGTRVRTLQTDGKPCPDTFHGQPACPTCESDDPKVRLFVNPAPGRLCKDAFHDSPPPRANTGQTHSVGDDCPGGHADDPLSNMEPADLLAAAHEAIDRTCSDDHLDSSWRVCPLCKSAHAAIDRAVEDAFTKGAEQAMTSWDEREADLLSKRDAEWREAAEKECAGACPGIDPGYQCRACRTVARMEGK